MKTLTKTISSIKSILSVPETRFLKNVMKNPADFVFYKKKYLIEKSLGKEERVSYVPNRFTVHITFRCNFRCPTCLYLLKDKDTFKQGKDMELKKFNWLLDRFKDNIKTVSFTGGEPTLHPQFSEIVKSVKERGLELKMSTNGTLLTKKINDLAAFDKINISLDGVDYEAFRKIRNGTKEQYNDIINGIHMLKERNIPFRVSFLLFEETLGEVKKVLDFAEKVRPEMLSFHSGNPRGSKEWTPLRKQSPLVQNFLKEITGRNDYPFSIKLPVIYDTESDLFRKQNCPKLWNNAYVGWDGAMSYCCYFQPDNEVGNIFKDYDFNSPKMVNFRKAMIDHKFPDDCLYCQRRFPDHFGYFEAKKNKWFMPEFK